MDRHKNIVTPLGWWPELGESSRDLPNAGILCSSRSICSTYQPRWQINKSKMTEQFVTFHNADWIASLLVSSVHFNEKTTTDKQRGTTSLWLRGLQRKLPRRSHCQRGDKTFFVVVVFFKMRRREKLTMESPVMGQFMRRQAWQCSVRLRCQWEN